jgi:nitroreductase
MRRSADLVAAVEYAVRAPSVHNTQPWRWRITDDAVELHADWGRHLVATDPLRRDLMLSCGAALHHLRVALAAQVVAVRVDRLPDPDDSGHLATVTVVGAAADPPADPPADLTLLPAITRRRTDRRRMSDHPVPPAQLQVLVEQARAEGALLVPVTGTAMRDRLDAALVEAAQRQEPTPGYRAELEVWTRRYAGARDGLPPANLVSPVVGTVAPAPLRRFPHGRLAPPHQQPGCGPTGDAAALLVVVTDGDEQLDRLRAGEATSAALLAATRLGLATTPLSQGIEVDATRRMIARDVLHVPEHPQLVLRIGRPAPDAGELPATPRRDLHAVLIRT